MAEKWLANACSDTPGPTLEGDKNPSLLAATDTTGEAETPPGNL